MKSPLRYPGSKARVWKYIKPYFEEARKTCSEYREPFLGGGSIFFNDRLDWNSVWLNDYDDDIAVFFQIVRDNPDELCRMVNLITPSLESWKEWKLLSPQSSLDRAFKTLFLNRTNYSGILNGRPIGGFTQSSDYAIGCRWRPPELISRIKTCSEKLQGMEITCQDFFYLIAEPSRNKTFLFLDPPYYHKGNSLYNEPMTPDDHKRLRDQLKETRHKFLLTYDDCPEVRELYSNIDGMYFLDRNWIYSIATPTPVDRTGSELFISNFHVEELTQYQFEPKREVG